MLCVNDLRAYCKRLANDFHRSLLLFNGNSSGINAPWVCMYYMFRHIAAIIIRYIELLQSPFRECVISAYAISSVFG
jgi:hypothetical protein